MVCVFMYLANVLLLGCDCVAHFCGKQIYWAIFGQQNKCSMLILLKSKNISEVSRSNLSLSRLQSYLFSNWPWRQINKRVFISNHILKQKRRKWKNWIFNFFQRDTPMILVSFFFSHRVLSKNLSRNGIGLKVTKFGDTNWQTFLV